MAKNSKILFVEPVLCAHSVGYLRAILANRNFCDQHDVHFLYADVGILDPGLLKPLETEFGLKFRAERIEVTGKGAGTGKLAGLAKIKQVLQEVETRQNSLGADHIAFLNVDLLIRFLGLPGMSAPSSLKGLLTGVYFNSRCFRETSLKSRLMKFIVKRGISDGTLKKIMFLDHGVIDIVKHELSGQANPDLGPAVDPWSIPPEIEAEPKSRAGKTFLSFGVHSVRKGTLLILKMLRDHPDAFQKDQFIIAGPVRDDIHAEFYRLLSEIKDQGLKIEVSDRYFEDQESWGLFEQADAVICPYVDFHGSSNVIIRAASYGLPVVGPDFGFLGELIAEEGIGEIYPHHSPSALCEAITRVKSHLETEPCHYDSPCRQYAEFHHEKNYAPSFIPSS